MNSFVKGIEDQLKTHHKSFGLKKSEVLDLKPGNTFIDQYLNKKLEANHIKFGSQDEEINVLSKLMNQANYDDLKDDFD